MARGLIGSMLLDLPCVRGVMGRVWRGVGGVRGAAGCRGGSRFCLARGPHACVVWYGAQSLATSREWTNISHESALGWVRRHLSRDCTRQAKVPAGRAARGCGTAVSGWRFAGPVGALMRVVGRAAGTARSVASTILDSRLDISRQEGAKAPFVAKVWGRVSRAARVGDHVACRMSGMVHGPVFHEKFSKIGNTNSRPDSRQKSRRFPSDRDPDVV